jgi:hypothetical protein
VKSEPWKPPLMIHCTRGEKRLCSLLLERTTQIAQSSQRNSLARPFWSNGDPPITVLCYHIDSRCEAARAIPVAQTERQRVYP